MVRHYYIPSDGPIRSCIPSSDQSFTSGWVGEDALAILCANRDEDDWELVEALNKRLMNGMSSRMLLDVGAIGRHDGIRDE